MHSTSPTQAHGERTLVLVKPDGVRRGLTGEILRRIESKGYGIDALTVIQATEGQLKRHYAGLAAKDFFPDLLRYMSSGPLVAAVVTGHRVVEGVRALTGATDPTLAIPGTIRGDLGCDHGTGDMENLMHSSDSREAADRETAIWFPGATTDHCGVPSGTGEIHPVATVDKAAEFQRGLYERAASDRKRIVLPEPDDDRVLHAAAEVLERGIADVVFVGDERTVRARGVELGLDLGSAAVVSVDDPELSVAYARELSRLRAHTGLTVEDAAERLRDVSYFGTMMVQMNDADGMVSGASHTTAETIVPSFQIIRTRPGTSIVSSVFLMLMKDRIWAFGDCAVNPNPNPQQLADIAVSSAETAASFGLDPKVAMLSYSTGASGSGSAVEAVTEATEAVRSRAPGLPVEGPIQFDAAVDPSVAAKKLPGSAVAGHANVLVFPELEAGNISYKAVQRSAGAIAVGPVLQGLNKPVNDLSRGALVEDIVNTIAITAIQAQG